MVICKSACCEGFPPPCPSCVVWIGLGDCSECRAYLRYLWEMDASLLLWRWTCDMKHSFTKYE